MSPGTTTSVVEDFNDADDDDGNDSDFDEDAPPPSAPPSARKQCAQFMDGMCMTLLMIAATLVSLCLPDLYVWGTDRSTDETVAWVNFICFILFIIEWVTNSFVMTKDTGFPPYLCGFFWWMDAAATFSMVGDIYFLAQIFAPPSTGGAKIKNMKVCLFCSQRLSLFSLSLSL
jgi:hypothetical protein